MTPFNTGSILLLTTLFFPGAAFGGTLVGGKAVLDKTVQSLIGTPAGRACGLSSSSAQKPATSCSAACEGAVGSWVADRDKQALDKIKKAFKGNGRSANPETALSFFLPVIEQLARDRDAAEARRLELQFSSVLGKGELGQMDPVKRMLFHWASNADALSKLKGFDQTLAGKVALEEVENFCVHEKSCKDAKACNTCRSGALAQIRTQAGFAAQQLTEALALVQQGSAAVAVACPTGKSPAIERKELAEFLKATFDEAYGPEGKHELVRAYTADPGRFAGAPLMDASSKVASASGAPAPGKGGAASAGGGVGGGGSRGAGASGASGAGGTTVAQVNPLALPAGTGDKPGINPTLKEACITEADLKEKRCSAFGFTQRIVKCEGGKCEPDAKFVQKRQDKTDCFGFLKEFGCNDATGKPVVLGRSGEVLAKAVASTTRDVALEEYGAFVARKKAGNLFETAVLIDAKALNDDAAFSKLVSRLTPGCLPRDEKALLLEQLDVRRKTMKQAIEEANALAKDKKSGAEYRSAHADFRKKIAEAAQKVRRYETASSQAGRMWQELGCGNHRVTGPSNGVVRLDRDGDSVGLKGEGFKAVPADRVKARAEFVKSLLKEAYKGEVNQILVERDGAPQIHCGHIFNLQRKAQDLYFEALDANPALQAVSKPSETIQVDYCQLGGEYRTFANTGERLGRWVSEVRGGVPSCKRSKTLADRIVDDKITDKPDELEKQLKASAEVLLADVVKDSAAICTKAHGLAEESGYLRLGNSDVLREFMECKDIGMASIECQSRHSWAPILCEAHKDFQADAKAQKNAEGLIDMGLAASGMALLPALALGPPGFVLAAGGTALTVGSAVYETTRALGSEKGLRRIRADYDGGIATARELDEATRNFDERNADFVVWQLANLAGMGLDAGDLKTGLRLYKEAKKTGRLGDFKKFAQDWHQAKKTRATFEKAKKMEKELSGVVDARLEKYRTALEKLPEQEKNELLKLYRERAGERFGPQAMLLKEDDVASLLDFDDVVTSAVKRGDLDLAKATDFRRQAQQMMKCCVKSGKPKC